MHLHIWVVLPGIALICPHLMIQTLQPSQPFRPSPMDHQEALGDFRSKCKIFTSITKKVDQRVWSVGPVDFCGVCESHPGFGPFKKWHVKRRRRRRTERPLRNQNFTLAMVFLCDCFGISDCSLLWEVWNIYRITKLLGCH